MASSTAKAVESSPVKRGEDRRAGTGHDKMRSIPREAPKPNAHLLDGANPGENVEAPRSHLGTAHSQAQPDSGSDRGERTIAEPGSVCSTENGKPVPADKATKLSQLTQSSASSEQADNVESTAASVDAVSSMQQQSTNATNGEAALPVNDGSSGPGSSTGDQEPSPKRAEAFAEREVANPDCESPAEFGGGDPACAPPSAGESEGNPATSTAPGITSNGTLSDAAQEETAEACVDVDPPADGASGDVLDAEICIGNDAEGRADGESGSGNAGAKSVDAAETEAVAAKIRALQATLAAREDQLERQAQQMAHMREAQAQLQAQNEELELHAKELEDDSLQKEFEQRLGAAERKVYALTKERDALKRGSGKLTSANELLKEKDDIIQQVMEEGEKLSKKQLELESALKKRSARVRELEALHEKLKVQLSSEAARYEQALMEKSDLARNLQHTEEMHKADLGVLKSKYQTMLNEAHEAQAAAESSARAAAQEGASHKLREAEAQVQTLSETTTELRTALNRLQMEAELKEHRLKEEISMLECRCQGAETRHEELAAKFPAATQPLLREIEAARTDAETQAKVWAESERSLMEQLDQAEAQAALAMEREKLASERVQSLRQGLSSMETSHEDQKRTIDSMTHRIDELQQQKTAAESEVHSLSEKVEDLQEQMSKRRQDAKEAVDKLKSEFAAEHAARAAAEQAQMDSAERLKEAQGQVAKLQAEVERCKTQGNSSGDLAGDAGSAGSAPSQKGQGVSDGPARQIPSSSSLSSNGERASRLPKEYGLETLAQQLRSAEATRDRLAEELVRESQRAESATSALIDLERLKEQHRDLESRYAAAVELLGEREEQLEELRADLQDVKELYKEQIAFLTEQAAMAEGHT
eukprot:evm.model.scf_194.7 EVM.evm.TU.scf_194.7   scf_194:69068-76365(+)